ncbi:MAG: hypothetical protein ABIW38_01900 [Ferruginibacter sp.]
MRHNQYLILAIGFFINQNIIAQTSDVLVLKKGSKSIARYYSGTHISFTTNNGAYRDAEITQIKNDSIYLQEFLVRRLPTTLGFYILDTAGSFRFVYHYNQIKNMGPAGNKNFNVSGSGAALLGGGLLLTLASGVVYVADREKFSPALLGAALGLGTVGYLMSKAGSKGIIIGKRGYQFQYINMQK